MPIDPRHLSAMLSACRHVVDLHTGPVIGIVSDSPTGPVPGVLITPNVIVIGLVVDDRTDRDALITRVRANLAEAAPGVPVSVSIISRDRLRDRPGPPGTTHT